MDNENLQTPSTSGPIPKEIEQQQQQQHKVIVQLGPTTRSLAVKKLSESTNEEIVGEGNAESQIEHDIHGDVVDEHEAEVIPCCSETLLPEDDPKQLQRKNQVWSSSETNRFYQGLKEHGKNFEQMSQFMAKYKIKRDKVQIQKYYFNTFKAYRAVTKISEDEFRNIPRDAKELFIIINGCEWKQKTLGAKICPDSFRQLLLNGTVTVKLKNRKVLVKTPPCKALRQFFKYDEKFANIPRQLGIRITPHSYKDKDYVISCEQNKFLYIKLDMNDSLNSLFKLLQRKWMPRSSTIAADDETRLPKFKLIFNQTTTFPKLIVRSLDDAQRRMCLQGLMKYCEDRNDIISDEHSNEACVPGFASPSSSNQGPQIRKKSRVEDIPSSVIVDSCSFADFSLKHDILSDGLSKDNVDNVSALHLYLITGMQTELSFTYQVYNLQERPPSVWDLFLSFVKRDYLWYGTDYMVHGTTHAFRKRKKLQQKKKRPEGEETKEEEDTAIVEDEMLGFLQQWNSMSKTSAILNQPEPEQAPPAEPQPSTAASSSMPQTTKAVILNSMPPPPIPSTTPSLIAPRPRNIPIIKADTLIARPRSLINRKRKAVEFVPQMPPPLPTASGAMVNTGQPTDFSFLNPAIIPSSSVPNKKAAPSCSTQLPPTTAFDPTIDGASLQRALTDEFSNQIGLMAQQNSVDYCRQFEDFVNYFQSPKKTSKLQ